VPKRPVVRVEGNELTGHPALLAWRQLSASGPTVKCIDILKGRNKSATFRLYGALPNGASVIAKRGYTETLRREYEIYSNVLPRMALSALRCFGWFNLETDEFAWLFLEDAGDEEFDPEIKSYRVLAARWLGRMHVGSLQLYPIMHLPPAGASRYRAHLQHARQVLLNCVSNPALSAEDMEVLDGAVSHCDDAEALWSRIEKECDGLPQTLVHGDFVPKNIRVRRDFDGSSLVLFDWEMVGWGPPAADLASVDLDAYWPVVRETWRGLDESTVHRMAELGKLFRNLAAIDWAAARLARAGPLVENAIARLRVYSSTGKTLSRRYR
jgi:Phosphotransferase enzyme family